MNRAHAAALWAGDGSVLAGVSAAALHGSKWIDDTLPAELIRTGTARSPSGIIVHTDALLPDEITMRDGIAVTTAARTAFDLGRWLAVDPAIVAIDALCNATKLERADVLQLADRYPGARRICQLRRVLDLVDGGAASPRETMTRLLIVREPPPPRDAGADPGRAGRPRRRVGHRLGAMAVGCRVRRQRSLAKPHAALP
ncbi:hypothetical protein [Tomitella biformata]|uniref:hypothetical protein n=1 Tax=Tomitella biformata TaxID=630403 RepID=UPI001F15D3FD|nr:hypothetical protein [Tomitella biformata]